MSLTLLRHDQHRRMPWRNGGGVTSEVARSPEGGSDADFDWRISFAEVSASGPFSTFPGVDRTILLVSGPPVLLEFADRAHTLRQLEPFEFDGEDAVDCTVSGPTRDLNVMTRRDAIRATVDIVRLGHVEATRSVGPSTGSGVLVVAVLDGALSVTGDEGTHTLEVGDVAVSRGPAPVTLHGSGVAAVFGLSPSPHSLPS